MIPEWSSYYIEYRYLKKIIQSLKNVLSSASSIASEPFLGSSDIVQEFLSEFSSQIEKVDQFYQVKITEIKEEIDSTTAYIYNLRRVSSLNEVEAKELLSIKEMDDNYSRATSMQRVFIELHQKVVWLESFCEFNHIGIHKIILKSGFNDFKNKVKNLNFEKWTEELAGIKEDLYDIIADEFFNGEKKRARDLLNDVKKFKNSDIGFLGCCLGVWVVLLPLACGVAGMNGISRVYPGFYFFRLIFMVGFSMMCFAAVIYLLEKHNINWQYIFEIPPSRKISYVSCLTSGIVLLTFWLVLFLLHLATCFYFPFLFNNVVVIFAGCFFFVLFVGPWKGFYREARYESILLLLNLVIAPFGEIRFKNYMFGSWTTSMILSFKDFYLTLLLVISGEFLSDSFDQGPELVIFLVSVLPFIWRILQNIKRVLWKKTSFKRQFWNFFRYSVSVGLSAIAYSELELGLTWSSLLITGICLTSIIDVKQDWQLTFPLEKKTTFSSPFLYFAIFSNFLLRFPGFFTMMPTRIFENKVIDAELLISLFAILEIIRRSIWSVLRIERESRDNQENFRDIDYIPVTFSKN
jgi:hypothetical protein